MTDSKTENKAYLIKNVKIIDPKNKISGDQMDLAIQGGKIVESKDLGSNVKEIDGNGLFAIPGAIDLKSMLYSQASNFARYTGISLNDPLVIEIPDFKTIQNNYLLHGFTFSIERDVPMTQSKMSLLNSSKHKLMDHGAIIDLGSNWSFLTDLQDEKLENLQLYLPKLLESLKGINFSLPSPYHTQFWDIKKPIDNVETIPLFNLKLKRVYEILLTAAAKSGLNLKPFIELYGKFNSGFRESNFNLLKSLKSLGNFVLGDFNLYYGNPNTEELDSAISQKDVISELSESKESPIFFEIVPYLFGGKHPLISRDRDFSGRVSEHSKFPMTSVDMEFDTEYYTSVLDLSVTDDFSSGIVVSWINSIFTLKANELISNTLLSTNIPIGTCFTDTVDLIAILLNKYYREEYASKHNLSGIFLDNIKNINKSLDLMDFAAITSSNSAKAIGMESVKGHLGIGADADIALFEGNPDELLGDDKSAYDKIVQTFGKVKYLFKSGVPVINNSEFETTDNIASGKFYYRKMPAIDETMKQNLEIVLRNKNSFYNRYYSLYMDSLENFSDESKFNLEGI